MYKNKTVVSFYHKHNVSLSNQHLRKTYLALAEQGYQVHYFTNHLVAVEHPNIFPHVLDNGDHPGKWHFALQALREIKKLKQQEAIEGYFVFSFFDALVATIAANRHAQKIWLFIRHAQRANTQARSWYKPRIMMRVLLEKAGMTVADQIFCPARYVIEHFAARNSYAKKMVYLPDNLPPVKHHVSSISKNPERPMQFVTAADLIPENNQLMVLKALADLPFKNWHYRLIGADVGNTEYEYQLRDFVFTQDLSKQVEFMGQPANAEALIASSDLFIYPAIQTNDSHQLLEALATGIPCIGSRLPEIAEILHSKLTFASDDPSNLQQTLTTFMQDPAARGLIAEKTAFCARQYAFDWQARLLKLIKDTDDHDSQCIQRIMAAKYQARG